MEKQEKIFSSGIWYNDPLERAPDYVLGSLSISVDEFCEFAKSQKKDDGKLRLSILRSKNGKPYMMVDSWESPQRKEHKQAINEAMDMLEGEITLEEIPF